MIIDNSNLQEMIFWNQIQYLGLPFISVLWLMVALLYTKTIYSKWIIVAFFFVPVVTFFMRLTNSWHHLFYTKMETKQIFGYCSLFMERGFWYYVNITHTLLCLFMTIIIYYLEYQKKRTGYARTQFLVFFFASLLPLIGVMLITFTYSSWGFDYTAFMIPISMFIIGYGIIKSDFLEVKTLVREKIFENNLDGMIVLESGIRVIDYNRAAMEFFGKLDISLDDSYPIEQIFERGSELMGVFNSEANRELSLAIDGEMRFFEIVAVPLGKPDDKKIKTLNSIRDITEKKRVQEKLITLATTDSLTGLYNREEFLKLAQQEFSWGQRHTENVSLLMIDIDFFKKINDTFGHAAGDEVIRKTGYMIMTGFRKTDFAGRIGGEEFAVLLRNTSLGEAKAAAEKFRGAVSREKVIYEEQEISFTVSIGVAVAHSGLNSISNVEVVLRQADDALYRAKARGRNCVVTVE